MEDKGTRWPGWDLVHTLLAQEKAAGSWEESKNSHWEKEGGRGTLKHRVGGMSEGCPRRRTGHSTTADARHMGFLKTGGNIPYTNDGLSAGCCGNHNFEFSG